VANPIHENQRSITFRLRVYGNVSDQILRGRRNATMTRDPAKPNVRPVTAAFLPASPVSPRFCMTMAR
jgi:hypothetical protein